jgi:hypothetical protein
MQIVTPKMPPIIGQDPKIDLRQKSKSTLTLKIDLAKRSKIANFKAFSADF